ncbi:MAG: CehA/McbA family metallohydrolase [Polyangiales bacterium]
MTHLKRIPYAILLSLLVCPSANAQVPLHFEGTVPDSAETHFFIPFEVPEGTVEIEIQHASGSSANILDWGLNDPSGFRGWGGGNTENAIVNADAASRSYVPGAIAAGTWNVVVGKAKIVETPATYSVDVYLRTEPTLAAQTERVPYSDPGVVTTGERWYKGDFHVHSRESGDSPAAMAAVLQAASDRGLDFILLSEHNTNSQLSYYASLREQFPNLLVFPGVEFTTYSGHANGIGSTQWVDHKIGVDGVTIEGAIDAFHSQNALFSINHAALGFLGDLCIGCGWDWPVPPEKIDAFEVITGAFVTSVELWNNMLNEGSHAAAIGGSDDHRAAMGTGATDAPIGTPTTFVYAKELSIDAIKKAILEGRTVVRTRSAKNAMVEFEIDGDRDGDTVYADSTVVRATFTDVESVAVASIVKNGEVIAETSVTSNPTTLEVTVDAPSSGEDRYRAQLGGLNSPSLVTSHLWLQPTANNPNPPTPTKSGGGCSLHRAATSSIGLVALIFAGFALRLRRRRH